MKRYLVIGNPIDHSLSPKLHNYWFNINKIDAVYEKKLINEKEIKGIVKKIKMGEINGANVTVPFKNAVVPFLDRLTLEANITKSVNTISLEGNEVVGYNTDVAGFELAIRYIKYNLNNKKVLIIGAGGVVSSIIYSLQKMKVKEIYIMNRTKENAQKIKEEFKNIKILNWGEISDFDINTFKPNQKWTKIMENHVF